MNGAHRWRHFSNVLCVLITVTGCDQIEMPKIGSGNSSSAKKESVAPTPVEAVPSAETPVSDAKPLTPEEVIADVLSKDGMDISDDDLVRLVALDSGLDRITELDLTSASLTVTGLDAVAKLPELKTLVLESTRLQGAAWQRLAKMTDLESLNLKRSGIDDQSLEVISPLTRLTSLDISGTRITDAGFIHLMSLSDLRELRISELAIRGMGMEALGSQGAKSPLRVIEANHTEFGYAGFLHLKDFPELEYLNVSAAEVTDGSLDGLRGARKLLFLNASSNRITDGGLRFLSGARNLETLNLSGIATITNQGLSNLRGFRKLNELNVNSTSCTPDGAMALKALLPDCTIQLQGQTY